MVVSFFSLPLLFFVALEIFPVVRLILSQLPVPPEESLPQPPGSGSPIHRLQGLSLETGSAEVRDAPVGCNISALRVLLCAALFRFHFPFPWPEP